MSSAASHHRRRLTEFSHGAGCGCKLGPGVLRDLVDRLAPRQHPDLLVGSASGDDAAVWRIADDRALVLTTDFFTPIVDDARTWGRIAATNAVSDIYAMGARPLVALNLVAWNNDELPVELLHEVLAGADDIAAEAGFVIAGGHSIDDPEPKYGLAVVGEVDPDRLLTNRGLRAGDVLVLSKPLGTGIITTAVKRELADDDALDAAVASMTRLNDVAATVATSRGATGATDVTGFGLLGHGGRMAAESGVDLVIDVEAVPILVEARRLAASGCTPGGTRRNLDHVIPTVDRGDADDTDLALLADPQTSGGLLFGLAAHEAHAAVDDLARTGHQAAIVARAVTGDGRLVLR
jgi:selenide,water dikinase